MGPIGSLCHLDTLTYLPDDILTKVDRTSMAHSLEARVPLVDHKILEFAATIPFEMKLRGSVTKWVLKEAVRDLLPPEILARPKQGFGVPLRRWLGGDFGRLAREVLLDPAAKRRGFFAPAAVEHLLERSDLRLDDQAQRIWALVCFELWSQIYLDRRPAREVASRLTHETAGAGEPGTDRPETTETAATAGTATIPSDPA
jgi:asparagine synthase (glutamine-hydrolysing)